MVMVYCSKRKQIKIHKEKGAQGRVQERPDASFQLSFPSGDTCTVLISRSNNV